MQIGNPAAIPANAAAPAIEVEGLTRRFGAVPALDQVSLTIRRGEFFSLLGPSGCGKTTLLRLIAGLDVPDAGTLRIGGRDAVAIPAHRRPVNTVFQSYALFPHLTVRDNVAFGLRMKRVPPAQLAERVGRVMGLVQISELAERRPAQLSGGQKQRVALARALVNEPEVLLLDEPLGALDLKLRKQLQVELHQLQQRLGITFIYVTHDQDEALTMSDRIAVMNAGRVEQLDRAGEIYERPRTRFVAQFLGSCNLIKGKPLPTEPGGLVCETTMGRLRVATGRKLAGDRPEGVTLAIRPEKVHLLTSADLRFGNCIGGRIEGLVYSGAESQYQVRVGEQQLNVVMLNNHNSAASFTIGAKVQCWLPEEALIPLDD